MNLRERIAYLVCPALKDEISALRGGNTKVVLENQRLLDAWIRSQRSVAELGVDRYVASAKQ